MAARAVPAQPSGEAWGLGFDLGCSHSRCAVQGGGGHPYTRAVPSALALAPDGSLAVGRAAARELENRHPNAVTHPTAALLSGWDLSHPRAPRGVRAPPPLHPAKLLHHLSGWCRGKIPGGVCPEGHTPCLAVHCALTTPERCAVAAAARAAFGQQQPVRLVQSPACAAYNWLLCTRALLHSEPRRMLCVDCGCRFTSACIADVVPATGSVTVRASAGLRIGGFEVTACLARDCPPPDAASLPTVWRLLAAADGAKHELGTLREAVICPLEQQRVLTAADLSAASKVLTRPLEQMLRELLAAKGGGLVRTAIVVGGSSRLPAVRAAVTALGLTLEVADTDFAVACGAAALAALSAGSGTGGVSQPPSASARRWWLAPAESPASARPAPATQASEPGACELQLPGGSASWLLFESTPESAPPPEAFAEAAARVPPPWRRAPPPADGVPPAAAPVCCTARVGAIAGGECAAAQLLIVEGASGEPHLSAPWGWAATAVWELDSAAAARALADEERLDAFRAALASCRNDLEEITLRIEGDELPVEQHSDAAAELLAAAKELCDVALPCTGSEDLEELRRLHRALTLMADAAGGSQGSPPEMEELAGGLAALLARRRSRGQESVASSGDSAPPSPPARAPELPRQQALLYSPTSATAKAAVRQFSTTPEDGPDQSSEQQQESWTTASEQPFRRGSTSPLNPMAQVPQRHGGARAAAALQAAGREPEASSQRTEPLCPVGAPPESERSEVPFGGSPDREHQEPHEQPRRRRCGRLRGRIQVCCAVS